MSVESASYFSQFNTLLPTALDLLSEGDNHLRLIKSVTQTQFPNLGAAAVNTTAAELNYSVGVTSNIQTQITALAAGISSAGVAPAWVSGTSYAIGASVYSPITLQTYRARVATSGTTDPSLDPTNWQVLGPLVLPISTISANTAAVVSTHYLITASLVLTLPATAAVGDVVQFTNVSGLKTASINPNGLKIKGDTSTMTLNATTAACLLKYTGATYGWVK